MSPWIPLPPLLEVDAVEAVAKNPAAGWAIIFVLLAGGAASLANNLPQIIRILKRGHAAPPQGLDSRLTDYIDSRANSAERRAVARFEEMEKHKREEHDALIKLIEALREDVEERAREDKAVFDRFIALEGSLAVELRTIRERLGEHDRWARDNAWRSTGTDRRSKPREPHEG